MPPLEFTLRLNSPGFLGSVDSERTHTVHFVKRGRTELKMLPIHAVDPAGIRIPALRGVLAFWLRSLLGGLPPERVFARQAAVLGSAGAGQGVRFRPAGRAQFEAGELAFDKGNPYAMLYLGYGPLQLVNDPQARARRVTTYHDQGCRDAILVPPETGRSGADRPRVPLAAFCAGAEQRRALEASLILLHLFGGLGGRSRRGWGSVEVEAPFLDRPRNDGDRVAWVRRLLAQAFEGVPGSRPAKGAEPRFTAFGGGSRVTVTPVIEGSYRDALFAFYRLFGQVRLYDRNNPPASPPISLADHDLEANDANATTLTAAPQRLAYGLPYAPQSSRSHWNIEYFGAAGKERLTRRASPLILKVHRLAPGRHFGTALFLPAAFFGRDGIEIGARTAHGRTKREKTNTVGLPGFGAVEAFMDAMAAGGSECPIPNP